MIKLLLAFTLLFTAPAFAGVDDCRPGKHYTDTMDRLNFEVRMLEGEELESIRDALQIPSFVKIVMTPTIAVMEQFMQDNAGQEPFTAVLAGYDENGCALGNKRYKMQTVIGILQGLAS